MAEIRRSRTIAAEAQAIWDVLADFGGVSSWAGIVDHSCLLSPAADDTGVGTMRRVQIGRDTLVERITEFEPPHALAYEVEGFSRRLHRVTNRWRLSPTGSTTVVVLTLTIEIGPSRPQRLAERAAARFAANRLDAILTGLTHRLEGSHV